MKNLLLLSLLPLLVSCSSDVVVKSDLGETSVIKESSVTKLKFEKDKAESEINRRLSIWESDFSAVECRNRKYDSVSRMCWKTHNNEVVPLKNYLAIIPSLPPIPIIKYRTIFTNVNGDKSATNYDHVACIPVGTSEERSSWSSIVIKYGPSGTEDNLSSDGSVGSGVRRAVCKKYG
ncbi:hypothetical protein OAL66_01755 [bacterium]|nr:hypothetical protein [bacterium]